MVVDDVGPDIYFDLMDEENTVVWTGLGRWLLIGLGGLMIFAATPFVFSQENGAAAGWNIFLGLVAIATVASGHRKAPLLALILAILMAIRLVVSITNGVGAFASVGSLMLFIIAAGAAYDLRKQSTSA